MAETLTRSVNIKKTIDKIVVHVTTEGHNTQSTVMKSIDIPIPYKKHVSMTTILYGKEEKEEKTYTVGRCGSLERDLCDYCTGIEFQNTISVEFFKEAETDEDPVKRACAFYSEAVKTFKDLPIKIIPREMLSSHVDKQNLNPFSYYITFEADSVKEEGITQKIILQ